MTQPVDLPFFLKDRFLTSPTLTPAWQISLVFWMVHVLPPAPRTLWSLLPFLLLHGEEAPIAAAHGLRHGRVPGGQILGLAAGDFDAVDELVDGMQRLAGEEAWQVVGDGLHFRRAQPVVVEDVVDVEPLHPGRRLPDLLLGFYCS